MADNTHADDPTTNDPSTNDPTTDDPTTDDPTTSSSGAKARAPFVRLATASEAQAALLEPLGGDSALNLFSTLANHPKLMRPWLRFGGQLLQRSALSDRERELVILRVAMRCGSEYEWGQHVGIARDAGLRNDEIERVGALEDEVQSGSTGPWTATEAALIRAADELLGDHVLSDQTWEQLSTTHSTEQLIELTMLVGHYAMLAGLLRTLQVPTEVPLPALGSAGPAES
ncbi:MAG: carboxymuconolactone decarboxylase family protein [Microthrixaceae bacterium]